MAIRIRYPVTWVDAPLAQPLADGDGDSFANDIVLDNGQNNLVLSVTMQQYTDLLSAAINGASRSFPERYIEVIYPLIKAGKLEFCEQVEDCIELTPQIQQLIQQVIINQGQTNPNSIDPDNTTGSDRLPDADTLPVSEPPPTCDKDELWAGIREMVDRIDQNGRDVLEDLQFINDKIEQFGEIIDLVPLLGDTIKDIGDLFTEQVPDILNAYNAASSPTFLDNVACDLFEMVCNECRYPTFDEVIEYFGSNSYVQIPAFQTLSYGTLWSIIKSVSLAADIPVWYTVNVWQCITLAMGGTFKTSHGKNSFAVWASFGEDNPNNNWEILCDGCGDTWCYQFDASNSFAGWTINQGVASVNGVDTEYLISGSEYSQRVNLSLDVPEPSITRIEMDFTFVDGEFWNSGSWFGIETDTNTNSESAGIGTTWTNETFMKFLEPNAGNLDVTCRIMCAKSLNNPNDVPNKTGYISAIRLFGNGTNPYGVDNCP